MKEGAARDGKYDYGEDEPLHVQIIGDTQEQVDQAAEMILPMLRPGTDEFEEIKQRQLHELALINGTVKETDYCQVCGKPGHLMQHCPEKDGAWKVSAELVTCKYCGDGGHPSVDCPLRLSGQASKLNDEYKSFLAELGVEAGPDGGGGGGFSGAPPASVGRIFNPMAGGGSGGGANGAGAGLGPRAGLGSQGRGGGGSVANSPNWMCPSCTNRNFMFRPGCNKCGTPRPAEYASHPDAQRGPPQQGEQQVDDARLYIGFVPSTW